MTYVKDFHNFRQVCFHENKQTNSCFIFPPHLAGVSTLPGETGNPEIVSFYLNVVCCFVKNTLKYSNIENQKEVEIYRFSIGNLLNYNY